jgi:hypothetical protein
MKTVNLIEKNVINTMNLNVDSPQIVELVSEFHRFARKTAEGVLEMAATVYRASNLKHYSEFVRFCELVGHDSRGSTIKKLRKIGERYEFLLAKAEKLPATWTTVYQIAQLANEEIERLIDKGVIHSQMQVRELDLALNKKPKGQPTEAIVKAQVPIGTPELPEMGFRVRLSQQLDNATTQRIRVLVSELKSIQYAQVEVSATLDAFLSA